MRFKARDGEIIAKEIGGEVLLVDSLAYYLDNRQRVAETFAEVFQPLTAMVAVIRSERI